MWEARAQNLLASILGLWAPLLQTPTVKGRRKEFPFLAALGQASALSPNGLPMPFAKLLQYCSHCTHFLSSTFSLHTYPASSPSLFSWWPLPVELRLPAHRKGVAPKLRGTKCLSIDRPASEGARAMENPR